MDKDEHLQSLDGLKFAPLSQSKQEKLRNLENQFNNENNTDYYFMVLEKK